MQKWNSYSTESTFLQCKSFFTYIFADIFFSFLLVLVLGWDRFHPAVPGTDFPWMSRATYGTQGTGPKMVAAFSSDMRNHQKYDLDHAWLNCELFAQTWFKASIKNFTNNLFVVSVNINIIVLH